ncbi:arginase deacetylase [Rickenella mellea]|uniref:histone deacetylase n=1 Tax=Rickenella mellea TaxID=50990 RepID=A0A4Y7Q4L2_9AGAM|nr:arginase deacetylase [Rickenella mellea]
MDQLECSVLQQISSLLPSNPNRSTLVHTLVSKLGLLSPKLPDGTASPLRCLRPRDATRKELEMYHTAQYLDFVLDPTNSDDSNISRDEYAEYGIEDDCPPFRGLPKYVTLVAGATLTAAEALRTGGYNVAVCWDGGRHHAQKSHAAGFCYVADCVLSILALRKPLPPLSPGLPTRKPKVMYLDLDVHFPDGVSHSFHQSSGKVPQVLTLSIHHASSGFYPISHLSGLPSPTDPSFDPFTLSIPLQPGYSCSTMARLWPIIESVKDAFKPDYVVLQCGVDALAGDPCSVGNWSLEAESQGENAPIDQKHEGGLGWCVRQVMRWGFKVLMLGGGGYNSPNAARAWAYLTSLAIDRPIPLDTPIPSTGHAPFPLYAPSFTLDIPPGNMRDLNSAEYLSEVERVFEMAVERLKERIGE